MKKDLQYYLSISYPVELIEEREVGVVARVPLLPGCITQGDTAAEAIELIDDAKLVWLETALEYGDEIPEPCNEYSGKFLLRLAKSLHRRLAERAKIDKVSLNQFCAGLLQERIAVMEERPRVEVHVHPTLSTPAAESFVGIQGESRHVHKYSSSNVEIVGGEETLQS